MPVLSEKINKSLPFRLESPSQLPGQNCDCSHKGPCERLDRLTASAIKVIEYALRECEGNVLQTSSFGIYSAVLVHLVKTVQQGVRRAGGGLPIYFIDTGFLHAETYQHCNALKEKWNLHLRTMTPAISTAHMEALHGKELWKSNYSLYSQITKLEPMAAALSESKAMGWLSGLRRGQTRFRSTLQWKDPKAGHTKYYPLLNWTDADMLHYIQRHSIPEHPLYKQNYRSLGDVHSSSPIPVSLSAGACNTILASGATSATAATAAATVSQEIRSTRFSGRRQECGLHCKLDFFRKSVSLPSLAGAEEKKSRGQSKQLDKRAFDFSDAESDADSSGARSPLTLGPSDSDDGRERAMSAPAELMTELEGKEGEGEEEREEDEMLEIEKELVSVFPTEISSFVAV